MLNHGNRKYYEMGLRLNCSSIRYSNLSSTYYRRLEVLSVNSDFTHLSLILLIWLMMPRSILS